MDHMLKNAVLEELISRIQWPVSLTIEKVTPIVHRGLKLLKEAGICSTTFEDGKMPSIGDIIGIAGKLSADVGKFGPELKGSEKQQTVLGVVDVLLSYLEAAKPAWRADLEQMKVVARDVLPASLSFAVSVAKGQLDLGSALRTAVAPRSGVAPLEHGRTLFRRFVGLLRRLTPALALCGASGVVATIVDQIEEAPRALAQALPPAAGQFLLDQMASQVATGTGLPIPSEKEPVAPPSTPRPSSEDPLAEEGVPPPVQEVAAEEVRSSSTIQEASVPEQSSPLLSARQVLHDA